MGSGKTTVLIKLAKALIESYQGEKKVPLVIIENEIGEINVDSNLLGGMKVQEIFAGCVCCTLSSDLTISINEIDREFDPEWIIVEATGLAYPDKIAETIRKYSTGCKDVLTITIADASRWFEIMEYMDVFLLGQMKTGDIILLNKVDLVDDTTLLDIQVKLAELKPDVSVISLSAKDELKDIQRRVCEYFE